MSVRKQNRKAKLGHVPIRASAIELVPLKNIRPSPENDTLYRPVDPNDPDLEALVASIRKHGLREPLVITLEGFILSGHRRYAAAKFAGLQKVPVVARTSCMATPALCLCCASTTVSA